MLGHEASESLMKHCLWLVGLYVVVGEEDKNGTGDCIYDLNRCSHGVTEGLIEWTSISGDKFTVALADDG